MLASRLKRIDYDYRWAVVDKETGEIHDVYPSPVAANWHIQLSEWDNLSLKRLNKLETIYCQLRGI